MSLFDVIRYPISDIPTFEQLNALPDDIFNSWAETTDWRNTARRRDGMARWYQAWHNALNNDDKKEINRLRQMIRDYDNEPI